MHSNHLAALALTLLLLCASLTLLLLLLVVSNTVVLHLLPLVLSLVCIAVPHATAVHTGLRLLLLSRWLLLLLVG